MLLRPPGITCEFRHVRLAAAGERSRGPRAETRRPDRELQQLPGWGLGSCGGDSVTEGGDGMEGVTGELKPWRKG